MANCYSLPPDKFWQTSRLNLPMNTTLHCNWYEQLNYFVCIVLPGVVEFIHKDMTFFEEKSDKARIAPIIDSDLARPWLKHLD